MQTDGFADARKFSSGIHYAVPEFENIKKLLERSYLGLSFQDKPNKSR
jgi:hypothetical protein